MSGFVIGLILIIVAQQLQIWILKRREKATAQFMVQQQLRRNPWIDMLGKVGSAPAGDTGNQG